MNAYFWVGRNSINQFRSGVVCTLNAAAAFEAASKAATTWSDDKYVIVRLERIE